MLIPFLAAAVVLAAPATKTTRSEAIEIVEGKSATVLVPFPLGQGANSNPDTIQAVPDVGARRLIFFGRKVGNASYTIFDARNRKHTIEYDIRVVSADLAEVAGNIRQIVPEGVTVTVAGDRILVEGEVVTPAEMERVNAAVEGRGDSVKNMVHYSDTATKAAAKTIEQRINDPR